ncbi:MULTISPECIES: hypothetical protein [Enterobacteriaceae]|uniref:hypothetical protein n=1 Tax=Enterobacteriaceae TaxID=543 RepID=UPI000AB99950|nr:MULTISPECIES: hypothetical protein [Enterobacteriaceae]
MIIRLTALKISIPNVGTTHFNGKSIFVNSNNISYLNESDNGASFLYLVNGVLIYVKETPEHIANIINNDS